MLGAKEGVVADSLGGHCLGPWLVVVRRWLPQSEKMGDGGRKEGIHGDDGLGLRHLGMELAHSSGSLINSLLEANGWSKLAKIAHR